MPLRAFGNRIQRQPLKVGIRRSGSSQAATEALLTLIGNQPVAAGQFLVAASEPVRAADIAVLHIYVEKLRRVRAAERQEAAGSN